MKAKKPWILYTIITTLTWGIWGAIIEIPEKNGFPPTLGYIAWAITMIPCALVALYIIGWKLDTDIKSILLGCFVGLAGAGGQLILFQALKEGPAYIIFPIISLYPILTIILSTSILKESTNRRQTIGIILALGAIFLLSQTSKSNESIAGFSWLILSALVFALWGLQAFAMKFSNNSMKAESIFFYMTISSILLTPAAIYMTPDTAIVNYGLNGGITALGIHTLNSIGALTLVYALRYGKSIIVVPLTGLAPAITIILSLILYRVWPETTLFAGLIISLVAIYLISE